jgi:hypothetical protein
VIELNQRVDLLKKIHLFAGLKLDQLSGVAAIFEEHEVSDGQIVFRQGDKPNGFYILFKGKVKVTRSGKKGEEDLIARLTVGDYFGEEALFENRDRSASITTIEDCVFLFLSRAGFDGLLSKHGNLKPNFMVAIKSHKLARETKFSWLGSKEVVYFVARRHVIRLYQALVMPCLCLLIPLGLFAWGTLVDAITPNVLAAISLLFIIAWIIWDWVDWGNDYYVVTNQRVVWLEKVVGLYDSRQEAPLSSILSVGVETDQVGRMLDYGNVIVRTYVGRLEFDYVDHPNQAAEMVREYWERIKSIVTVSQKDVMKNTIREKLGLPVEKKKEPELPPVVAVDNALAKQPLWWIAFKGVFSLRTEDAGKVIYHKHWVVFIEEALLPLFILILLFVLQSWRGVYLFNSTAESLFYRNSENAFRPDTIMATLPILSLPVILWIVWVYVDWKNDIFMLTAEEIMDFDRKPFGREEKRTAQIENILSTSYKRRGFLGYFFNYGTVEITVGGSRFDFQDVADPASVQADINRRRMVRIAQKNENAGKDDRERFATWIAAYHENIEDFEALEKKAVESSTSQQAANNNLDDMLIDDDGSDSDGQQGDSDWN